MIPSAVRSAGGTEIDAEAAKAAAASWEAGDKALSAQFKPSGKTFTVALKTNAGESGRCLSENTGCLYEEFRRQTRDE